MMLGFIGLGSTPPHKAYDKKPLLLLPLPPPPFSFTLPYPTLGMGCTWLGLAFRSIMILICKFMLMHVDVVKG